MENDIGIISAKDENKMRIAEWLKQLLLRIEIFMLFFISGFKVIIKEIHVIIFNAGIYSMLPARDD